MHQIIMLKAGIAHLVNGRMSTKIDRDRLGDMRTSVAKVRMSLSFPGFTELVFLRPALVAARKPKQTMEFDRGKRRSTKESKVLSKSL
jgi:hypothetical protein